jgi:ribosomal protein S18 acetylase RimI-like enzyme
MSDIRIEALRPESAPEASRVLARAFVTNPVHVAAFGPDQLSRNEAFFRSGLAAMKGQKVVALEGSQIVGLLHSVLSPDCQFSGPEKLRMTPAMIGGFGLRPALRVSSSLSAWAKHDPSGPHSHLGPIGIEPGAQGRRIGQQLMDRFCEELDRTGTAGYLETDKPENARFYGHFGFETTGEIPVLGVTNYLMWRKPRSTAA